MKSLWTKLHSILWLWRFDVWFFEGEERSQGGPFAFAYAGDEPNADRLAHRALAEGYRRRKLGRFWAWETEEKTRAAAPDCAFLAYELSAAKARTVKRFLGGVRFQIPLWIRVQVDLDETVQANARVKAKRRNMHRLIRSFGFEAELSTHPEDFREFYESMHLPYIQKRRGEAPVERSYAELKRRFRRHGELVFVCRDGERLGGVVIDDKGGAANGLLFGVLDGDERHLKTGVSDALFCFQLERMRKRGFLAAGLGNSRAFLNDRALQYKRRLGGHLVSLDAGFFTFRFFRRTDPLESFLTANPFVAAEKGGSLRAVFFAPHALGPLADEDWKQMESTAFCEGLDGMDLYVDDDSPLPLKLEPENDLPPVRALRLGSVLPAAKSATVSFSSREAVSV